MSTVDQLDYTSERVNPTWYRHSPSEYLIYLFHTATYQFAEQFTRGKRVLDYGCGTGYGSAMLAKSASCVTGIDVARDVVQHATQVYGSSDLEFRHVQPAEVGPLPFEDQSFDAVVSFQVMEHIHELDAYLSEIHRVLRPGGQFVVATPDRSTRLFPGQKPWNMHHVTEFSARQLEQILGVYFDDVEMFGMKGDPEVLELELSRTLRMKWMLLPLTLPVVPEPLRYAGLSAAKAAMERIRKRDDGVVGDFGFNESAIRIGPHEKGCVNLISVARKAGSVNTDVAEGGTRQ